MKIELEIYRPSEKLPEDAGNVMIYVRGSWAVGFYSDYNKRKRWCYWKGGAEYVHSIVEFWHYPINIETLRGME